MRQAYDYWQDQPGNFFVSTATPHTRGRRRHGTHTKGSRGSQSVIEDKKCQKGGLERRLTAARLFFGIFVPFTTIPIVRGNSADSALTGHAASRRAAFDADNDRSDRAQRLGSSRNATDPQISTDYVYPSGIHTDSFNLSTGSQ